MSVLVGNPSPGVHVVVVLEHSREGGSVEQGVDRLHSLEDERAESRGNLQLCLREVYFLDVGVEVLKADEGVLEPHEELKGLLVKQLCRQRGAESVDGYMMFSWETGVPWNLFFLSWRILKEGLIHPTQTLGATNMQRILIDLDYSLMIKSSTPYGGRGLFR